MAPPLTNTAMSKIDPSQQLSSLKSSIHQVSLASSIEKYAEDHCLSNLLNKFINKKDFQECYAELKNNTNPVDVGDAFCEYFDGDETLGKENEKDSIDYIKILEGKGVEYSKHALFDDDDVSDITSQIPIGSINSKSDTSCNIREKECILSHLMLFICLCNADSRVRAVRLYQPTRATKSTLQK
jgi:hypothetical protein